MAANPSPFSQYGAWNEHWLNHPAGLPKSQYKSGTNPNQGTASYSTWAKSQQAAANPSGNTTTTGSTTPSTNTSNTTQTNTATSTSTPGTTATTGFASRYTPAMLDQVYENPWYILSDVFSGLKESSPMYQSLRDLGGDPLTLFNIAKGSQSKVGGGAADFTNWLADLYGQQGKVGGQRLDAQALMGMLFGQEKFGADSQNVLGQILGSGDMSTQIRTLYNMARDVSNVGMNPLAARGYQAALAQAGDKYGGQMMETPAGAAGPQNPASWLKANMPWLALGA